MSRFLSRAVVAPAPPRPGPGADCLKCKFAVESLHAAVSSPDAITQLIAQADDLCDKYAAQFELDAECEAAVEKYGPSALTKARCDLSLSTALVPIRPRSRGARRFLRTFSPGISLRPPHAFNARPRRLSTPLLTPFDSAPTSL